MVKLEGDVASLKKSGDASVSKVVSEKNKVDKELKASTLKIITMQDEKAKLEAHMATLKSDLERTANKLREDMAKIGRERDELAKSLQDAQSSNKEAARSDQLFDFLLFTFSKKIIVLPGGQINDPSSGKRYFLPFLPATPLSPTRTLEGLLTLHPSRALDLPLLLPELQRDKDIVRCVTLGAEVPGHCQEQRTQILIVRLLETHFLHCSQIVKSQQNGIEFVTRPGTCQC